MADKKVEATLKRLQKIEEQKKKLADLEKKIKKREKEREQKKWAKIDARIGAYMRSLNEKNFEGVTLESLKTEVRRMTGEI